MNDELIAAAELGEEARNFLESDLGRCILGIAKQEALLAQERLVDVDPENMVLIRELQNSAKMSIHFEQWLYELLSKGENALAAFMQQNDVT